MSAVNAAPREALDAGRLGARLETGRQQAGRAGRATLVSVVLPVSTSDPLGFYARGARLSDVRSFWSSPGAGQVVVGVGEAWTITVDGTGRFADAREGWRDRCAAMLVQSETNAPGTGPVLLGGFAFDPLRPSTAPWRGYPAGRLTLPRFVLTATPDQTWLTINSLVSPGGAGETAERTVERAQFLLVGPAVDSAPRPVAAPPRLDDPRPASEWKELVRSAVARIRGGELEKVVLARACRARSEARLDPARILGRLRADYPGCFVFAIARGDRCFLGASPEQLVSLRQGMVRTICLAGSGARGATVEDDCRLGDELLASAKNRSEHAIVARGIRDRLAGAGVQLAPSGAPSLLKLRNIQHLATPIIGHAPGDLAILDLIAKLHPTPSVGGQPGDAALRFIRDHEGLDRGWYAGPVGWLDAWGQGEFAVAIRSALLSGDVATLFAGCGIVADSDPELEYAESCLKLKPMLSALASAQNGEPAGLPGVTVLPSPPTPSPRRGGRGRG
ncbi:MAG: isochorismate synthase [Chloroflexota bacterium]